jgi:hypothetical protein
MKQHVAEVDFTPIMETLRAQDAQTITGLEDALRETRELVLQLVAVSYRACLQMPYSFETRAEMEHWLQVAIKAIVQQAERGLETASAASEWSEDELDHMSYDLRPRLNCPMCGQGGSNGDGYLPVGLFRHLDGYGSTQRCPVIHAALNLARSRTKGTTQR